jgi:hypothetical protein
MAAHPAPTKMLPDLAQHQAAHAMDAKATHRALQIPEILEHILVHLPIKDLFVHQRVSRTFQISIAQSPAIQTKMFLELSDTPRESWKLIHSGGETETGTATWQFVSVDPGGNNNDMFLATPVTFNPILKVFWPTVHGSKSSAQRMCWNSEGRRGWQWPLLTYSGGHEQVLLEAPEDSVGGHSSLFKTYISDPPCKVAYVSTEFMSVRPRPTTPHGELLYSLESVEKKVESETGLKLGDLWAASLNHHGYSYSTCQDESMLDCMLDWEVANLRQVLIEMKNPSIALKTPWTFEMADAVVPTDEEWADVRQRGA